MICIYLLTCVEGVQMPPLFYMQDITCLSQLQLNDRKRSDRAVAGPQKNPVLAAIPRGWRMLMSVPGFQKGPLSRRLSKPRPL